MEKTKKYSRQDIESLVSWFEKHSETLPKSMKVDEATFIQDTGFTLPNYIYMAKSYAESENETYLGMVEMLYRIKGIIETKINTENND